MIWLLRVIVYSLRTSTPALLAGKLGPVHPAAFSGCLLLSGQTAGITGRTLTRQDRESAPVNDLDELNNCHVAMVSSEFAS